MRSRSGGSRVDGSGGGRCQRSSMRGTMGHGGIVATCKTYTRFREGKVERRREGCEVGALPAIILLVSACPLHVLVWSVQTAHRFKIREVRHKSRSEEKSSVLLCFSSETTLSECDCLAATRLGKSVHVRHQPHRSVSAMDEEVWFLTVTSVGWVLDEKLSTGSSSHIHGGGWSCVEGARLRLATPERGRGARRVGP